MNDIIIARIGSCSIGWLNFDKVCEKYGLDPDTTALYIQIYLKSDVTRSYRTNGMIVLRKANVVGDRVKYYHGGEIRKILSRILNKL